MTELEVLQITDLAGLRRLTPADFSGRCMSRAEFEHIFQLCRAFWAFDYASDPGSQPHAILTAGGHSDGFINCLKVFSYPELLEIFAAELARTIRINYGVQVDWVVGSAYAAITLGQRVAAMLGSRSHCTEKGRDADGHEIQVWSRFTIEPDEVVLDVEELMTTATTALRVLRGISAAHEDSINFAPIIATLVDRREKFADVFVDGSRVVSSFRYDNIQVWQPSECPLCPAGSKAVRPKQLWDKFSKS